MRETHTIRNPFQSCRMRERSPILKIHPACCQPRLPENPKPAREPRAHRVSYGFRRSASYIIPLGLVRPQNPLLSERLCGCIYMSGELQAEPAPALCVTVKME
jgi:hypothetical protein